MTLLLIEPDGTVKARCVECDALVIVSQSCRGIAVCSSCMKAVDERSAVLNAVDFPNRRKRLKA